MSTSADLAHHIAGRLRLRIPAAKGNPDLLRSIKESLERMPGVHRVKTNVKLGSVVLQYDPAAFTDFVRTITEHAAQHDLFTVAAEDTTPCVSETDQSLKRLLSEVNRTVHHATGGVINLKELFPLALGLHGLVFVNRSAAAAQWINWIQVAFDTYIDLHEDEPVAEVAEAIESLGALLIEQQTQSMETLRSELASLRAEVRAIADRQPRA